MKYIDFFFTIKSRKKNECHNLKYFKTENMSFENTNYYAVTKNLPLFFRLRHISKSFIMVTILLLYVTINFQ